MWIDGQPFWYYLVTYVFFEVVYAMELIPVRDAGGGDVTGLQGQGEVCRRAPSVRPDIAAILAGILPGRIIESFGKSSAETFFYLGLIFAAIFMFVALMVFLFSRERPRE